MIGYKFKDHENLIYHSNKFWFNDKPCKLVYNNGSKSVLVGNKKFGIKKLRKQAVKIEFDKVKLPF